MQVPIESADIRSVYMLEVSGHRSNRQPEHDPRIDKIRMKLLQKLKAKREKLCPTNSRTC